MALKSLTAVVAAAFLLASSESSFAQQSTPPLSRQQQIDPHPWIPPKPTDPTALKNWLRLTDPKMKHILPVIVNIPDRWHRGGQIGGGLPPRYPPELSGKQNVFIAGTNNESFNWSGLAILVVRI
jgi:hypothetical protein